MSVVVEVLLFFKVMNKVDASALGGDLAFYRLQYTKEREQKQAYKELMTGGNQQGLSQTPNR